MAACMIVTVVFLLFVMRSLKVTADDQTIDKLPLMGKYFSCVNDTCVLNKLPSSGERNGEPNGSIDVCRLTCGPYGALWPRPTVKTTIKKSIIEFGLENVQFNLSSVADDLSKQYLSEASEVFLNSLKALCKPKCVSYANNPTIYINTTTPFDYLKWTTNERYELSIATEGNKITVNITAQTVYGARHGLETLRQLIATYGVQENGKNLVMASDVSISDQPAYAHRGFMLDTSRHYFPISAIKRTIDGMGHSKLNTFHWHATDTHSFPLDLPSVPLMAKYGAYSAEQKYSYDDIKDLLRYALVRGVRVIIEIDSPAHAGNGWQWGKSEGYGDLAVCIDRAPWRKYCIQPPCGQLNPINDNTYKWLGKLYKDLVSLFPKGEAFHMGGDEVFTNCWNNTLEIVEWMKKNKNSLSENAFFELWAEFHAKALKAFDSEVGDANSDIIVWSSGLTEPEIIQKHLDKKRFVVEVWEDPTVPVKLAELGYKVIVAIKDVYYLDHGFWSPTNYHSWQLIYNTKMPTSKSNLILGAETCMWSEYVDELGLDFKVWPRTAALAERLWTNPSTRSQAAEYRMQQHRERLITLGIKPDATMPEWCYDREGLCSLE